MHRGLSRAAVAATLLATLVVPAVTSPAGERARLQEIEREREAIEAKIEVKEAKAADLMATIDKLDTRLRNVQIEMVRLDERIKDIEAQVSTALVRIEAIENEIAKIEEAAIEQAVALYKTGATDTIEALLEAQSLSELDAKVELLGVASRKTTGALVRYGRLNLEIEAEHQALFNLREDLTAERKHKAELRKEWLADKATHAEALAELNKRLNVQRNKEGDLQDAADRITGRLEAIAARNSVEKLGTSAYGYIWPLNGNVTSPYGYRWGRMHSGIDIDGYTGQPIVASKEGTVVMAEYYSGYGLTVVVNHGGGYATLYAHLSATTVLDGQEIEQGDMVGRVGCTGSCTGDHLHFEVRVNGDPRDPMQYLP
ncbi:MAG: peptidoglycan DD-metalloendopeptidase family protein [Actinomycetota bacterium]|nr:peptidoglycan DD-metalloendopeptidase family protein [Actinomycetota bacterium]